MSRQQILRAIQRVQADIVKYPREFWNEQQTIHSLIGPILKALGWDPNDRSRVKHEYPIGRERVDMALIHEGKVVALVEAKALGISFGPKEIDQVSGYCFREGVQTAILTNGAEWNIYRPQQLRNLPFEQRQLFHIRIDGDEEALESTARKLARISYDEIGDIEIHAWRILLEDYWNKHANRALLEPFTKILRKSFAREIEKKTIEVPLGIVRALLTDKLDSKPTPVPIPDRAVILAGERHAVRYAKDVLIQTVEWLIRKNHLRREDCPIRISERSSRYLIHSQPRHPNNQEFYSAVPLSNGLYLESHGSKPGVIRNARLLVERYGHPPNTLRLVGFDG